MLAYEVTNDRCLDPNINRRSRTVSANLRSEANNAHLNSVTDYSTSRVTIATVSALFNSRTEHAIGDASPDGVALILIEDWLLNL